MIDRRNKGGFTLIELMFAMAFVAFLMIFIVTSIVQIMRIYNKGLAIRDINQSGRQLVEDMTRSLRYANALQFSANGYQAASQRICTNGVTYAWNIENAAGINEINKYSGIDASNPVIRFIRVDDKGGLLCNIPAPAIPKVQSRDLLSPQLAIQQLSLSSTEAGHIVTVDSVIATQGLNRPLGPGRPTVSGFECPVGSDGAFCAFGNFQTTVYIRN